MSALGTFSRVAVGLLPELLEIIQARLDAGESEDDIRRDIQSQLATIAANRAGRDQEMDDKFGPAVSTFGEAPAGALGGPLEEGD